MATHSSILAWRIPLREKPGGLQSMGSQRVGHDLATNNNNIAGRALMLNHPHGTLPKVEAAIGQTVLQIVMQLVSVLNAIRKSLGERSCQVGGGGQGGFFWKGHSKAQICKGKERGWRRAVQRVLGQRAERWEWV